MEVMVDCPCGQVFAFQEEPVNGRLGTPVSCPQCGTDRTDSANDYIGKVSRGQDPFPAKKRSLFDFGLGASKRRLDPRDLSDPKDRRRDGTSAAKPGPASPTRLVFGSVAALGVGVLGAVGWYWIAEKTGFHFGFLAWVIGGLVGLACRLIVPQGSFLLASLSGASAFAAILAGHVLVLQVELDKLITKGVERAYQMSLDYAKRGVGLKTDRDVKVFLAEHSARTAKLNVRGGQAAQAPAKLSATQQRELYLMSIVLFEVMDRDKVGLPNFADLATKADPERVSAADVKEFREREVPELQRLMDGKPSKEAWKATLTQAIYARIRFHDVITTSIGPYTIAWMIFGLITAFKLAYNKSETEDIV